MGRYCSYLLPKQGGGTFQIQVNKTQSSSTWDTLYILNPTLISMSTKACPRPDGPPCRLNKRGTQFPYKFSYEIQSNLPQLQVGRPLPPPPGQHHQQRRRRHRGSRWQGRPGRSALLPAPRQYRSRTGRSSQKARSIILQPYSSTP